MALEFWTNKSGEKRLCEELFDSIAEEKGKILAKDYYESKEKLNNPTQIRRFFDEIVTFNSRCDLLVKSADADKKLSVFKQQLPFVMMLIPKVRYAYARELVSKNFMTLMEDSTKCITEPEDLKVFTSFFEAVIGNFKYYIKVLKDEYRNKNTYNASKHNERRY